MPKVGRPKYKIPECMSEEGTICLTCQEHFRGTSKFKGRFIAEPSIAENLPNAIGVHMRSDTHKGVLKEIAARKSSASIGEITRRRDLKASSEKIQYVLKLFEIVYYLAFNAQSYDTFGDLRASHGRNGAFDEWPHLTSIGNATYNTNGFLKVALCILATLVWRGARQKAQAAKFIGMMIDEVDDCMIRAKLLCFYRFASPTGEIVVQYAGCENLALGKGAA